MNPDQPSEDISISNNGVTATTDNMRMTPLEHPLLMII